MSVYVSYDPLYFGQPNSIKMNGCFFGFYASEWKGLAMHKTACIVGNFYALLYHLLPLPELYH